MGKKRLDVRDRFLEATYKSVFKGCCSFLFFGWVDSFGIRGRKKHVRLSEAFVQDDFGDLLESKLE